MKIIKRTLCFAFIMVISSVCFGIYAFAGEINIKDLAGYLTSDEIFELEAQAQMLSDETGYNIGIVLTDDIGSKSPMEFSDDYYTEMFGNNIDGFMILINNDTKTDWISTAGDAIMMYSDERISNIHSDSKQMLIDEEYYDALAQYLNSFEYYYLEGYPSENEEYYLNTETGKIEIIKDKGRYTLVSLIIALAVGGITILIIVNRYKFHTIPSAECYLNGDDTEIKENSDVFLREYTTSVRIQSNSGSGGGGSSTHFSSSGGTFGGGGSSR